MTEFGEIRPIPSGGGRTTVTGKLNISPHIGHPNADFNFAMSTGVSTVAGFSPGGAADISRAGGDRVRRARISAESDSAERESASITQFQQDESEPNFLATAASPSPRKPRAARCDAMRRDA